MSIDIFQNTVVNFVNNGISGFRRFGAYNVLKNGKNHAIIIKLWEFSGDVREALPTSENTMGGNDHE